MDTTLLDGMFRDTNHIFAGYGNSALFNFGLGMGIAIWVISVGMSLVQTGFNSILAKQFAPGLLGYFIKRHANFLGLTMIIWLGAQMGSRAYLDMTPIEIQALRALIISGGSDGLVGAFIGMMALALVGGSIGSAFSQPQPETDDKPNPRWVAFGHRLSNWYTNLSIVQTMREKEKQIEKAIDNGPMYIKIATFSLIMLPLFGWVALIGWMLSTMPEAREFLFAYIAAILFVLGIFALMIPTYILKERSREAFAKKHGITRHELRIMLKSVDDLNTDTFTIAGKNFKIRDGRGWREIIEVTGDEW